MDCAEFIRAAGRVRPNENQLRFLRETPFYVFVHFSPNTFTDLEWGTGKESPGVFAPTDLDCDQWARAIKSAGATGMVLTAKHHDGFCLWPSKQTEHSVKNSPYKNGKGDIVREASEACRRHGLKFGFYLSPWDRNAKCYGTPEYNDFYRAQLTELLTGYGEIFYVWFDGACGEGPGGRKQVYEFESYIELIRKYQPKAVFFNDAGEIRWCGNESGATGASQWSVVPGELCFLNKEVQTGPGPLAGYGTPRGMYNSDPEIGALETDLYSKGLVFSPAETDMSIRPGWFWHPNEEPHSLDRLFDTYLRTVGGNTTFNLNVPPDRRGRFDERDVKRLAELGERVRGAFANEIPAKKTKIADPRYPDQPTFRLEFQNTRRVRYVTLEEHIENGQRVSSFALYVNSHGEMRKEYPGTTIGSRRIVPLDAETDALEIRVRSSRAEVEDLTVRVYA